MRKQNSLFFDKLNIGGTLEALVHSYVNDIPLIIDDPVLPFELDLCPADWDLTRFGFEGKAVSKLQLWDRLTFLLSVSGYLLFPNNIQNIRSAKNKITIITTDNSSFSVFYKKVKLFEPTPTDRIKIFDWFTVRSGCFHSIDILRSESDFVNKVVFYPSRRHSVKKGNKDLVAVSLIREAEKDNPNFAEGMCRLKVLRMMKENGILGTSNGYNRYGKPVFNPVKIEHTEREFKIPSSSDSSIRKLLKTPQNKKSDLWKLTQKLLLRQKISTLRESFR